MIHLGLDFFVSAQCLILKVSAKKMQVGTLTKKNHIKVPTCIFSADTLRTGHCADTKKTRSDTSKVTNIEFMFSKCNKLKEIKGINKFNTSEAIKMNSMFEECNELEYLDLSSFDTSKVNDMESIISKCYELKKIKGINKFNTKEVKDMATMFGECKELEYLDLTNFNTSNANNMEFMLN